MNNLSSFFKNVQHGEKITLAENGVYHVCSEDSYCLKGFYCSNTAKRKENPKGEQHAAIFLQNKKNIKIDGNGAHIIIHGKLTPFIFNCCENITVKNLTVDYAVPTMSEFDVLSSLNGIVDINIHSDCLFDVIGNKLVFHGEKGHNGKYYWINNPVKPKHMIRVFDKETRKYSLFDRRDFAFKKIEKTGSNTLRVHLKNKSAPFKVNTVFQIRNIVRDTMGSLFLRCKNLYFENLRIKFMNGLGMVSQFSENITYKNCNFNPSEDRTAASTADFFQFSGCKGDILIDSCCCEGAHDDYVNVHGTHLRIICINKRKQSITVRFMHDESWGFQAFDCGDEIEFIKWDTLAPFGKSIVKSFKRLNNTDIRLYLDRPVPDVELNHDVVENITCTPSLTVKNCNFGSTCGRGILCTTRGDVLIENNRFEKLYGAALLVEDDCNFWFESGYTTNVVFKNNVVDCCEYAMSFNGSPSIRYSPKVMNNDSEHFVHGKLSVCGNTFLNPAEKTHCFELSYVKNVNIAENIFDAPYKLNLHCVGNVSDSDNLIKIK